MIQRLVLQLIRFYQRVLSPLKPPSCRFSPTCSHYTYDAIERFGLLQGSWLGLKRLCRCHPWHPGGYDPVPEKVSAQHQTSHQETELSHKELDEQ